MKNFEYINDSGLLIDFEILKQEHGLSLKSIGLYVRIVALAHLKDWEFSVEGIASISKESYSAVNTGIKELEETGLLERSRPRGDDGKLGGAFWTIRSKPIPKPVAATEKPPIGDFPDLDDPDLDNRGQRREALKKGTKEESIPPTPLARGAKPPSAESFEERLKAVYNEHKPEGWRTKRTLTAEHMKQARFWADKFGCEDELLVALEKALRQAQNESWWSGKPLGLETMLRTTKDHIIGLSEKHDATVAKEKRKATAVREYSPNASDRPGPKLKYIKPGELKNHR